MERMLDFFYHHKRFLWIFVILFVGGIFSIWAFSYDNVLEQEEIVSDSSVVEKEEKVPEDFLEDSNIFDGSEECYRVDVKGMVLHPNVYEIKPNTRIYEVLTMAGGVIEGATTENINLSKKVTDEMVIYVFSKEEYDLIKPTKKNEYSYEITEEIVKGESIIESDQDTLEDSRIQVSLNYGSIEDFIKINGLGKAKAENIITYREEHGSFESVEEVKEVSGIGEALYEKIKDYLTL